MCFGCSKDLSHGDGSFEYPQHMFWFRNKKNNFQLAHLSGRLGSSVLVSEKRSMPCTPKDETLANNIDPELMS